MIGRASNSGSATDSNSSTQQLDFVIGITNMTWPGIAAVEGGFANLTAAGMRTTNVLNSQMNLLGAGMMAAGGTAALALGLMTAEAAKFEKQMAVVQALIQKTGDTSSSMASTMQGLSSVAKELSMKYGVSLSEITSSMESLGRAGLTTAGQMTSVLEPALQLSKIEGITTDVASDEIIKMVNLFGGTYERDATPLATILAHAANISTTSATDIYNALKYSGGVASSIWGNQDQNQIYTNAKNITAMIATLSQQGVTGALAGTSIRSFFQYVTNPTAKSKKALTAIGLNNTSLLTTNSAGESVAKDPMEIFNTLNTAFKKNKMSDLQVLQWFQNWGQGKMGQQYVKLFPGGTESPLLAKYVKQMNEQYSMQERVNTIMSSATEQWNKLTAAVEVFGVSVGETGLPLLKAITSALTTLSQVLAGNKIAATLFSTALYGLMFGGIYAVGKWLAPMVTTPLRDMETFIGKARTQVAQIKGTKGALEEEAGAATGVATAMDKKTAAKTRATQANKQLAQSAGVTATSINKVKGEVTGATVATREYTGRVQDLEKNYVPIVAPNGSAADAKKMAEYEKAMTSESYLKTWQSGFLGSSGYAFNPLGGNTYGLTSSKFGTQRIHPEMENFLKTLTYGNGIGAYAPINAYESHIENLGKQLREQEWVQGSAFPNISQNAMIKGNSDINPLWNEQIGTSKKYDALEAQVMKDSYNLNTIGSERDSAAMKKFNALNNGIEEYETALHKYDGVAGKQLLISDKFNAGKARLSGSIGSFGDTVGRTLKSSGGKLKSAATGGLEWLGALAGLGGVTGGAIVAGAAVGVGAYYAAWKSGYFDTATTKANNALKNEQKYVKSLSDKKDDLQKRQEILQNQQSQYTVGSKEYLAVGKDIANLTKEQTNAQTDLSVAQQQLTKDQQRAYQINQSWASVQANWTNSFDTSAVEAARAKTYGVSSYSSIELNDALSELEKRNGTMQDIENEAKGITTETLTGNTSAGRYYSTPGGANAYRQTMNDISTKGKDYANMKGYYYNEETGEYEKLDSSSFWTPLTEWWGGTKYQYWDKTVTSTDKTLAGLGTNTGDIGKIWGTFMSADNPISLLTSGALWSKQLGANTNSWLKSLGLFGGTKNSSNTTSTSSGGLSVSIGSIITKLGPQEAQNAVTNAIVAAAKMLETDQSTKVGG